MSHCPSTLRAGVRSRTWRPRSPSRTIRVRRQHLSVGPGRAGQARRRAGAGAGLRVVEFRVNCRRHRELHTQLRESVCAIGAGRFRNSGARSTLAPGDRSTGTVPISRPDGCGRPADDSSTRHRFAFAGSPASRCALPPSRPSQLLTWWDRRFSVIESVVQAVAFWAALPCWRIRIGLPNGSRTPMSVP